MHTFIAILRGINVSGNRMIKMDDLRQMFLNMGFTRIKTYIQSGNVIFQSLQDDIKQLEEIISTQIHSQYGFQVPVIVISIGELKYIIDNNLYLTDNTKTLNHLHVTFLSACPKQILVDELNSDQSLTDDFIIDKRVVYLHCPQGYSKSKLSNGFIENKLKVSATTRNWKTMNELLALALQVSGQTDNG